MMEYAVVKEENKLQTIGDGLILPYEEIWVQHHHFLCDRGYQLRPRYNPDWVPSWRVNPVKNGSYKNEDAIPAWPKCVDAVSRSNGQRVMIKHIELSSEELSILTYVNTPSALKDPRNHCVRLLDVILLPACETHVLVVTPLLYEHSVIPFRHVGEVVEMTLQFVECLEFLHEHNIAHRDFCRHNVLIDGGRLVPDGWHPWDHLAPPDGRHGGFERFKWVKRWSTRPNSYYLIDFGYSRRFETKDGVLLGGIYGQDNSVPEMSLTVPYDPFPVDVYHVGNMLLKFYGKYCANGSIDKLTKVAQTMAHKDPSARYTAREAAKEIDRVTMSAQNYKSDKEALADTIAEVNLIDQALSEFSGDTIVYNALLDLVSSLRQEHRELVDALEVHATQKDRLSKGVLGPLVGVLGTIKLWAKIKVGLSKLRGRQEKLEQRASDHQELVDAIAQLRRETEPTRASLSAYKGIRASEEGVAGGAGGLPQGNPPALTAIQKTTNIRYRQMAALQKSEATSLTVPFASSSATASTGNRSTTFSTPPEGPIGGLSSPIGEAQAQAPRPSARTTLERDYSHLSVLPAQYLERAEDVQNIPHRSSADIPPPEPEAPYIPPNALPLPPRHFYAFGDPAQPERVPAAASGHTRGLSDLSAFKNLNANRSTSTFSSREYAGSLGPGYSSSGSDQPRQIRAGSSVGGDSWGSSERLDEVQNTNYAAGYQSDIGSFDEQPRISRDSESSGSHQGGQ